MNLFWFATFLFLQNVVWHIRTPREILINSPSPQTCVADSSSISYRHHQCPSTSMNLWIQRSCVQPNLQSCPVVRCVLQLQFSTFLTPELFNSKKSHHVSSESKHLRNSDKFFLSSSGIRAWLVLVPKGCKSSKPDKVPRSVSIPTHTKTLGAFQVSTTIWQNKRLTRKVSLSFQDHCWISAEAFWTQAGGILYMDRAAKVKVPGAARSFFYHLNSHLRFWKRSRFGFGLTRMCLNYFLFPGSIVRKVSCQMFVKVSLAWCRTLSSCHSFQFINDHSCQVCYNFAPGL